MSDFIRQETELPRYYQFPDFLIRLPISQTAKLAYMLLYDRARLSRKNNRIKDGCVYVNFTIKSMAEALGRSVSTVKNAYRELDEKGLLIRTDGGFSKPNDLYVMLPECSQFSDLMRKPASVKLENDTHRGSYSVAETGRNLASNKVIETNNYNQNNRVNLRTVFGKYKNIYLSDTEYEELRKRYPYRIDQLIEEMSSYMAMTGNTYQNYEAALYNWAERENRSGKLTSSKAGFPDYSYNEGESL